jgi:hypothetical protein
VIQILDYCWFSFNNWFNYYFNIRFNNLWCSSFWTREIKLGNPNDLQTKKAWDEFKGGFFVGACGSAGFAFICLSSIPTLHRINYLYKYIKSVKYLTDLIYKII